MKPDDHIQAIEEQVQESFCEKFSWFSRADDVESVDLERRNRFLGG